MNYDFLKGRKVSLWYKPYVQLKQNLGLFHTKLKYIEGTVDKFYFDSGIILNDDRYGFNIIPTNAIVYLEELRED